MLTRRESLYCLLVASVFSMLPSFVRRAFPLNLSVGRWQRTKWERNILAFDAPEEWFRMATWCAWGRTDKGQIRRVTINGVIFATDKAMDTDARLLEKESALDLEMREYMQDFAKTGEYTYTVDGTEATRRRHKIVRLLSEKRVGVPLFRYGEDGTVWWPSPPREEFTASLL